MGVLGNLPVGNTYNWTRTSITSTERYVLRRFPIHQKPLLT